MDADPQPDLDRLAAAMREDPDDAQAQQQLWDATFRLERWWFAPHGPAGQERPAVAQTDDHVMMFGFTSMSRCHEFALQQGLVAAGAEFNAIAMPPIAVVSDVEDLAAAGIEGLMMDHHVHGYYTMLGNLPQMWRYLYRTEPRPGTPPGPIDE